MRIESFRPLLSSLTQLQQMTSASSQVNGANAGTGAGATTAAAALQNAGDHLSMSGGNSAQTALTYSLQQLQQLQQQVTSATGNMGAAQVAPGQSAAMPPSGAGAATGPNFGDQVNQAINHVNELQQNANDLVETTASGNPEDAHKAVIAMEHAMMALDLTLQVRNKVLDAFKQITDMPI